MNEKFGWTELTSSSAPNFVDKDGDAYLVRCPECKRENYAPNVMSGICTWCGYDLNKHKTILNARSRGNNKT